MRIASALIFAALVAAAPSSGFAAPLSETAAAQTKPDPTAPVITFLKAGSEPTPAATAVDLPPGWEAVQLPGPFEAYVLNRDLTKALDVRAGAPYFLAPKPDAGVLATAEKADKTEIIGLYGRWTKVRLSKAVVGYVEVGGTAPVATMTDASAVAQPAAVAVPTVGKPAPAGSSSADLPQFYSGKLTSTRRPFAPRRPFDWQLDDATGTRFAYLDLAKLLLTEQIDNYADHAVVVYGTLKPGPGKDLVIEVENLRLP